MDSTGKSKEIASIVLGRFNILHPGHIQLIQSAYSDILNCKSKSKRLVIVIGSAQTSNPPIEERVDVMSRQLVVLGIQADIETMVDPDPIDQWIDVLNEICPDCFKTLYRADDDIPEEDIRRLNKSNIYLSIEPRRPFMWLCQDGLFRLAESSSDIRKLMS